MSAGCRSNVNQAYWNHLYLLVDSYFLFRDFGRFDFSADTKKDIEWWLEFGCPKWGRDNES